MYLLWLTSEEGNNLICRKWCEKARKRQCVWKGGGIKKIQSNNWKSELTRRKIVRWKTHLKLVTLNKKKIKKPPSTSASLPLLKPLTMWITTNSGIFLKRWEFQTTLPASWETCMQDKKQAVRTDIEQQTGSKLGKDYDKAVYCHPACLIYMQSTSAYKC